MPIEKQFFFISVVVPVEEKQAEGHDEEEEEDVNAQPGVSLDRLLDLLVGFSHVLRGADDRVGNALDVAFLQRDLKNSTSRQQFRLDLLLTFSVKSSCSFAMS